MIYGYYMGYGWGHSRDNGGCYWYVRKYPNILFESKFDMFDFIDAMENVHKVVVEKMSL